MNFALRTVFEQFIFRPDALTVSVIVCIKVSIAEPGSGADCRSRSLFEILRENITSSLDQEHILPLQSYTVRFY